MRGSICIAIFTRLPRPEQMVGRRSLGRAPRCAEPFPLCNWHAKTSVPDSFVRMGSQRNIWPRPTAWKAWGKCSIDAGRRPSGQTMATTSNRQGYSGAGRSVSRNGARRGSVGRCSLRGHRLGRHPLSTRLDLDEDHEIAIAGDQVDLTLVGPVSPDEDPQARSSEESGGLAFAMVAEPVVPEGSTTGFIARRTPEGRPCSWSGRRPAIARPPGPPGSSHRKVGTTWASRKPQPIRRRPSRDPCPTRRSDRRLGSG